MVSNEGFSKVFTHKQQHSWISHPFINPPSYLFFTTILISWSNRLTSYSQEVATIVVEAIIIFCLGVQKIFRRGQFQRHFLFCVGGVRCCCFRQQRFRFQRRDSFFLFFSASVFAGGVKRRKARILTEK